MRYGLPETGERIFAEELIVRFEVLVDAAEGLVDDVCGEVHDFAEELGGGGDFGVFAPGGFEDVCALVFESGEVSMGGGWGVGINEIDRVNETSKWNEINETGRMKWDQ